MCDGGHALFRLYDAGCWYLGCCMCPYRILEGRTEAAVQDVPIPDEPITPEDRLNAQHQVRSVLASPGA